MIKCKNKECHKFAALGQAYCSRECAPYGNYGEDKKVKARRVKKQNSQSGTGIYQKYLGNKEAGS